MCFAHHLEINEESISQMCTHTDNRWFSNDSESKLSSSFPKILCSVRVSLSLFLSASLCIHSFNDILKSHLAKTEFSFPDTCALLGTRVRLYKTLFLSPHPPLFSPLSPCLITLIIDQMTSDLSLLN